MKRICKWGLALIVAFAAVLMIDNVAFAQETTVDDVAKGVDTVWVLVSGILVFLMQAGFALLESGAARSKNTVNILMKNLFDFSAAAFAYLAVGYAFMFGEAGTSFIGLSGFFLGEFGGEQVDLAFWFFQLMFAATAATIVSGAMAERTKFGAYLIVSLVITAFIYPISGGWVWSGNGWLGGMGFSDFAGSTVVHSLGGWAALMGAIVVGARTGRFDAEGKPQTLPGSSMPLAALGVFILWFGWFGFNAGSELAAVGGSADAIALIAANTTIAAAMGGAGAMLYTWLKNGKPKMSMSFNGVIGGLVAITAPCASVTPVQSVIIGLVGGCLVVWGAEMLEKLKIDDPVGAVPAHLVAGVWGTLAVGLFPFSVEQIIAQVIGIAAFAVWGAGTSFILFKAVDSAMGLRVSEEEELRGMDWDEHGEVAYGDINTPGTTVAGAPTGAGVSRAPAK